MATLVALLIFCQTFGAVVGAFTAIWSELAYMKAMRNGKIDQAERAHLLVIGRGLKYGMTVLLLASFGLVVAAYLEMTPLQPALSPAYWTFIALALLIISVSRSLSHRRIAFPLGSATLFTAWWFLAYLSFGWISLSFGAAVMSFIVATVIFYAVLHYARLLASPR